MLCLTFDIEERFHAHLTSAGVQPRWELHDRVASCIDWLASMNRRATFFIVGEFAERHPHLVRRAVEAGCEVGSHTYSHLKIDSHNAKQCLADIKRSKELLEEITGLPVSGFRAPTWTARLEDRWLWDYLVELGFLYDSSLFPFPTPLYGSLRNPTHSAWIFPRLLEIPPAVFRWGSFRIPYAGGFYFRLYPLALTRLLLSRELKAGKSPVLYFHPWDFERSPVTMERGLLNKFIGNHNVSNSWGRFVSLLRSQPSSRCIDYYRSVTVHGFSHS
ncbi:MAG: polysaccharide deacetylase family protein [Armatimonadetes bacterium]|nr:polysaccharide deacetylase family protein [Armatimonadota bacterium]